MCGHIYHLVAKYKNRPLQFVYRSVGLPRWERIVKDPPAKAAGIGDIHSIPGSGKSPGEWNGNPLQRSCLEHPMDRGAWEATVQRAAQNWNDWNDLTHQSVTKDPPEADQRPRPSLTVYPMWPRNSDRHKCQRLANPLRFFFKKPCGFFKVTIIRKNHKYRWLQFDHSLNMCLMDQITWTLSSSFGNQRILTCKLASLAPSSQYLNLMNIHFSLAHSKHYMLY